MSAMAGGSGVPATCGLLPLRWDSRSTLPAGTMQMPCYGRLSQALHLCCNSAALSRGIFQDVSRDDIVIIVGLVDLDDGATSLLHVLHDCIYFVSSLRYFDVEHLLGCEATFEALCVLSCRACTVSLCIILLFQLNHY